MELRDGFRLLWLQASSYKTVIRKYRCRFSGEMHHLVSGMTFTEALYDSDEQAIILYTSADIRRTTPVTITIPKYRSLWYYRLGTQRWFLPALNAAVPAETIDYFTYETRPQPHPRFRREFGLTGLFLPSVSSLRIQCHCGCGFVCKSAACFHITDLGVTPNEDTRTSSPSQPI